MRQADCVIVAAEPSGDQLGADLYRSLKSRKPDIYVKGIGGSTMQGAGLDSLISIDGLAILGFAEGLKAYPFVLRKVREATNIILDENPKTVILIDSWGFMVRVAKALKNRGFQGTIIKYVAPQVWAMRSGRAKTLARYIDHLLSTQPMDRPYFEAAGLAQTFVGNPVLDRDYQSGNAEAFRAQHNLDCSLPVIGYFFGSRPSEIEKVGPAIVKTQRQVHELRPDIQSVVVVAESVRPKVETLANQFCGVKTLVPQDELIHAFSAMDAALACSGTITTQLAAAGVPTVVLYKLSPLTYAVARHLFRPRFMSLVNISADESVGGTSEALMPEFIQDDIFSDGPTLALLESLDAPPELAQTLMQETRRMGAGSGSASDRAADAILKLTA